MIAVKKKEEELKKLNQEKKEKDKNDEIEEFQSRIVNNEKKFSALEKDIEKVRKNERYSLRISRKKWSKRKPTLHNNKQ